MEGKSELKKFWIQVKKLKQRNKKEIKKEQKNFTRDKKSYKKYLYDKWRNSVEIRDNYTCQICKTSYLGIKKGHQVSHILSKENYSQLMYEINNGIFLCFSCHKNAKISSHLDGFAFSYWLMKNKEEQYNYLIDYLDILNKSVSQLF